MFTAIITDSYHSINYATFRGVGMNKSPKKAMELAQKALEQDFSRDDLGAAGTPILKVWQLYKDNKLVSDRHC